MKSDTPIDYAEFQLSPKRSRCELFISRNGNMEKLASGLVKPFTMHLRIAEEQFARAVLSIKLEVEKHGNTDTWFTKGTLERFVRFVSTPEVLDMVNTFDSEVSQLEAARKIYSQGAGIQLSAATGADGNGAIEGSDATKKELLRAIDVRLAAVRQDLTMACSRASAAGFNPDTVLNLQLFADRFGAHRLNEACTKFISLCQRRPDLINTWKLKVEDRVVRSLCGSDMSIEDPFEDEPSGSHLLVLEKHQHPKAGLEQQQEEEPSQAQHHLNQSSTPTCQQPNSSHLKGQQNIQNKNKEEGKKKEEAVTDSSPGQLNQPARRLSVQDRINLFENKQKENSGGKPIAVGKSAELRRLSSDVSSGPAVEKAVLRRWSAASDMSVDSGNDKKENTNTESPSCTPSSSSVSQAKSNAFPGLSEDNKVQKGVNDSVGSVKDETKSGSEFDQGELQTHGVGLVGKDGEMGLKDYFGADKRNDLVIDQVSFEGKSRVFPNRVESSSVNKSEAGFQTQIGSFADKVGDVEVGNKVEDFKLRDQPPSHSRFRGPQTHTRSLSAQLDGGFGVKVKGVPYKNSEGDQSALQPQWRSFTGEVERSMKDITSSAKESIQGEEFEVSRMKVQKPPSAGLGQTRKMHGRNNEGDSANESNRPVFASNKVLESQDSLTAQAPSTEQVQRLRQFKGNQELHDELKMKANELEKLFAEHKLRVPGDQSGSTRRSKPTDAQGGLGVSSHHRKLAAVKISPVKIHDKKTALESLESSDVGNFSTPPMKTVDQQDYNSPPRQNLSELSLSDDSRGKLYQRYMQKRDAKLREEWGMKRSEKEAKLKSMQDSFEKSRVEMKAKFSGSAGRQDSVSNARRRAEKLQSFHFHSSMKREQTLDSVRSEEDGDLSDYYGQGRSFSETPLGDAAPRSSQNKKLLPNKNISSSTPRTIAAPVPRVSAKTTNPCSGRRRAQSENPLAQSVPNFSDFRKENTKPSPGSSKPANRSQVRTYACSKSNNEEVPLSKEEKPRRSHSLRKSIANTVEFKDLPPLEPDGVVLASLKFDKEQSEQIPREKSFKNESKPFLRKGNGIGPGAGASVVKMKASVASETLKNEEFEESLFVAEDLVDAVKEEEEEFQTIEADDCTNMDNEKPRMSCESDKMGMSESENGYSQRYPSQIDISSVGDLPASLPTTFHAVGSLQESPGESPLSWNSRMHHPFTYPHEAMDIDASVDSPIGSPASWNSHSLNQTEVDAARMRKKWGSAQKPTLAANTSHIQSRKDVTKGFKRLLKFGRRSRGGTESLADWISATTSEGDDDTEDGRDPANWSSEDLRKSRMGFFTHGHPSDDGFNASEFLNDQAQALQSSIAAPPSNFKLREDHMSASTIKGATRSFFSLSSFRSKGSESKPR